MTAVIHLKPEAYRSQPWKNGLGETKEIAVEGSDPYLWRVSLASVPASGPFSPFPGYDRTLVLLEGGPITLSHESGKQKKVLPLMPYSFKGEWATDASVESPSRDFNVFTLRGKAKAGVYPAYFKAGEELRFPVGGREHFLFVLAGRIEVLDPNRDQRFDTASGDTLRLSRQTDRELMNLRATSRERAACLWVVIHHELA